MSLDEIIEYLKNNPGDFARLIKRLPTEAAAAVGAEPYAFARILESQAEQAGTVLSDHPEAMINVIKGFGRGQK